MAELLRFWFTFERPVGRREYLRHGLALMALKYVADASVILLATGVFWAPWSYVSSVSLLRMLWLSDAPGWLAPVLAIWTLPFLWVGITLTLRRLLDAGASAWWSLLFFVPLVSYGVFVVLSLARSDPTPGSYPPPEPDGTRLPSALLSMAAGAGLGVALIAVGVLFLNSYGLAVFMGTPFVIGLVTAYLLVRRYPATPRETQEVVLMTTMFVASLIFFVGIEGAVCLAMVAPLAVVLAMLGGIVGRRLALLGEGPVRGTLLIVLLLPGSAALESGPQPAHLREVRSAVVIDAPPELVWDEVIAFSPIPEPDALIFRLGLAYPTHAEIRGSGVGAVRYCHFSTGAFVEPITAWEPGRRLSFDVAESPSPLEELSPWDVTPPHLQGYLQPSAGEFRLIPMSDGRTRLEGSTWYEQRLRPEGYWVVFSDYIIGRIHRRVLEHIKSRVEHPDPSVATIRG